MVHARPQGHIKRPNLRIMGINEEEVQTKGIGKIYSIQ
jgi:hypothetical protein